MEPAALRSLHRGGASLQQRRVLARDAIPRYWILRDAMGVRATSSMKAIVDKVADRVLSLLGLGLDFSVDLRDRFFTQVTPTLYLGARPTRERVQELRSAGVTHIVSCLKEEDRLQMEFLQQDFRHLFFGVHDGIREDIAGTFSQFFDFTEAATASDPNAKLFVHCEVGVSRSATTPWRRSG